MWVVKLGGSLFESAELRAWLEACASPAEVPCTVVAGGGRLADCVRASQARWHYGDALAHALALETMGLNARVLQALQPTLPLASVIDARSPEAQTASALWCPPRPWHACPLPANWTVTSDSIALWLAATLGAQALILVKSIAPAAGRDLGPDALARAGIVDEHFPTLHRAQPVPFVLATRGDSDLLLRARKSGRLAHLNPAD